MFGIVKSMMTATGLRRLLRPRFLLGLAAVAGLLMLVVPWFLSYRGHVTPFGKGTDALAGQAADRFVDLLPAYDKTKLNPIVVFPFKGPKGAVMADRLRETIDRSNRYDVIGQGSVEKVLRSLDVELRQPVDESDACRYGKRLNAQGVIVGEVVRVDERSTPPVLEVRAVLLAVEGGGRWTVSFPPPAKEAVTKPASDDSGGGFGTAALGTLYWIGVGVGYTLLCLATAFIFYPVTRRVLARQRNLPNALLLAALALLDTAVLWLVVGPASVAGAMVLVAVGYALALILNFVSCSFIESRR